MQSVGHAFPRMSPLQDDADLAIDLDWPALLPNADEEMRPVEAEFHRQRRSRLCPPGLPQVDAKRSDAEWMRQLQDLERRLVYCNMITNVSKVRLFRKRSQ